VDPVLVLRWPGPWSHGAGHSVLAGCTDDVHRNHLRRRKIPSRRPGCVRAAGKLAAATRIHPAPPRPRSARAAAAKSAKIRATGSTERTPSTLRPACQ